MFGTYKGYLPVVTGITLKYILVSYEPNSGRPSKQNMANSGFPMVLQLFRGRPGSLRYGTFMGHTAL
jgi:hypothetical protein